MDATSGMPDWLMGLVRQILLFVGGYAAAKGISAELWAQIGGLVMAAVGVVWMYLVKKGTVAIPTTSVTASTPTVSPVTGKVNT